MRTSQAESIRKPIEQAIKALNDYFEAEKESQEFAAEFERREAMPEGTDPATKLERATKKQYEQDVRGGGRTVQSRPGIAKYYALRHRVEEAARHLADCGWTTEAEAIYRELDDVPKNSEPIDWSQPKEREEIRTEVFNAANRIRDILTACLGEMFPKKDFPELLELRTEVQRLTVGCGRIWMSYKESQVKVERQGKRVQILRSEAYPIASGLKPSLTLEEFKYYAKEGSKPGGRFKEWVHGSKGNKIPLEKFFE
jgi:hypothetical protein